MTRGEGKQIVGIGPPVVSVLPQNLQTSCDFNQALIPCYHRILLNGSEAALTRMQVHTMMSICSGTNSVMCRFGECPGGNLRIDQNQTLLFSHRVQKLFAVGLPPLENEPVL